MSRGCTEPPFLRSTDRRHALRLLANLNLDRCSAHPTAAVGEDYRTRSKRKLRTVVRLIVKPVTPSGTAGKLDQIDQRPVERVGKHWLQRDLRAAGDLEHETRGARDDIIGNLEIGAGVAAGVLPQLRRRRRKPSTTCSDTSGFGPAPVTRIWRGRPSAGARNSATTGAPGIEKRFVAGGAIQRCRQGRRLHPSTPTACHPARTRDRRCRLPDRGTGRCCSRARQP